MTRRIIQIDETRCNGCGACVRACHEGAIALVDGRARLMRDDYCDGLGDCLPACPMDAISFVEREAAAYDGDAVARHRSGSGCPGTRSQSISHAPAEGEVRRIPGMLSNFPVQIRLAPTRAPYFDAAELLIAADCTAYAYGSFHPDFIAGRVTLIACPKLDNTDYAEKLAHIFGENDIRSITVTRMTVPCCGGLEFMVRTALEMCKKEIPLRIVTISPDGCIVRQA